MKPEGTFLAMAERGRWVDALYLTAKREFVVWHEISDRVERLNESEARDWVFAALMDGCLSIGVALQRQRRAVG